MPQHYDRPVTGKVTLDDAGNLTSILRERNEKRSPLEPVAALGGAMTQGAGALAELGGEISGAAGADRLLSGEGNVLDLVDTMGLVADVVPGNAGMGLGLLLGAMKLAPTERRLLGPGIRRIAANLIDDGSDVGRAVGTYIDENKLFRLHSIQGPGAGTLGKKKMLELLQELTDIFPDLERVTGMRISGRGKGDLTVPQRFRDRARAADPTRQAPDG
ncbi:MAG: hypothetical protein ACYS7Y_29995 [Planctomycetota bacterium]|jgi:hypothetical protein